MRCYEERLDLASYALGVLDERGCGRIEAHLAACDDCARELEGMLPVTGVLAGVDRDEAIAALTREPSLDPLWEDGLAQPSEPPLRMELPAPRRRLARPQGWRLAAMLGAAAAVIAIGVVLGILPSGEGSPQISAGAGGTPVPTGAGGITARESDSAEGRTFWAVNPKTGTRLDITFASRQSGTRLTFALSEGQGPLRCRLVTIDARGGVEVVSSWQVPAEGYGTVRNPERLNLQANSSLPISDIARVDVQALDQADRPTVLLDLPVH